MSLQSNYYRTAFLQIKRGNYRGKVSNAKIYYILALLDMIDMGLIVDNKIMFNEELIERYKACCFACSDVVTPIEKPYFHLSSSLFYHMKWKEGIEITSYAKSPSSKFIRENAEFAYLDEALWKLLMDSDYRREVKQLMIKAYLKQ